MSVVVRPSTLLLPIIYLGFISLGLPDGTLGAAWPRLHRDIAAPVGAAGMLVVVITLLSAFSGLNSGRIIARFATAPVVAVSCLLTGAALVLTSRASDLAWLLVASVPLGLGAGAVDAGLNGYVARHYTGRHMNWLHACWGIGASGGPLVMAYALGTDAGWRGGYLALGLAQLGLAALFVLTFAHWSRVPERTAESGADGADITGPRPRATANSTAGWLSVVIFAIYVAAEGTSGVWAGTILVEARGVPASTAGVCVAGFFGAITIGRFLVGLVVDRKGNRRLITLGCGLAVAGGLIFAVARSTPGAITGLVLLGFGFAPIYPGLMHEVPRRFVSESVQVVIGRQSAAAYVGAASLPAASGWLAAWSLELIPWVVIACISVLALAIHRLNRLT